MWRRSWLKESSEPWRSTTEGSSEELGVGAGRGDLAAPGFGVLVSREPADVPGDEKVPEARNSESAGLRDGETVTRHARSPFPGGGAGLREWMDGHMAPFVGDPLLLVVGPAPAGVSSLRFTLSEWYLGFRIIDLLVAEEGEVHG